MKTRIETKLNDWEDLKFNQQHFFGDKRFNLRMQDYSIRGTHKNKPDTYPTQRLTFNPEYTNYGLVLQIENQDIALIGFNLIENEQSIDCLQIQGKKGAYKELSPISWEQILLFSVIKFAKESELDTVKIIPHHLVEGIDNTNPERIIKRYDNNARKNNFIYNQREQRFIFEFN